MTIVYAPNPTGTGHNMRALAIAAQVRELKPEVEQTVLLGSMQDTFRPMFAEAKVEVVDIAPKATNTALHSHLSDRLDWENMVSNYLVPTFLNGDRILRMLGHFRDVDTEIVVSDYNPVAGIAAHIAGLPHVLVTERFNFSLVNVTNDQLVKGGAEVDSVELDRARAALDQVFRLITSTAAAVVTDKPSLPNYVLDKEFRSLEENGKAQFVGR